MPNAKFNAFLTYDLDHWNVALYGRNLGNKTTIASALIASGLVGFPVTGTLDPPRLFGIRFGYHF